MDLFGEHFFWITSRAAGIAALLLASASVGLGLTMGGRWAGSRMRDIRPVHETLSLATLVALVVHAGSLLFDGYLRPSLADITIPLVSSYNTLWTSIGIVAGWLLLILGGSFYVRARIGVARWRKLHRFTALAWILAIGHALGEGTDAGTWWFLTALAVTTLPVLALLAVRLSGSSQARPTLPTPPRPKLQP